MVTLARIMILSLGIVSHLAVSKPVHTPMWSSFRTPFPRIPGPTVGHARLGWLTLANALHDGERYNIDSSTLFLSLGRLLSSAL